MMHHYINVSLHPYSINIKMNETEHVFIAPACSRVQYRRPIFRQSVRQSVRPSVNIYVDVRHLC